MSSNDLGDERAAFDYAVTAVNAASGITHIGTAGHYICDGTDEVPDPSDYDLIVFLLWRQWGPRSGRYSSAYKRIFAVTRKTGVDRLMYFRVLPDDVLVDPDDDTRRIVAFRDEVEREGTETVTWYDDSHGLRVAFRDDLRLRLNLNRNQRPPLLTLPDHQKRLAGWARALEQATRGDNQKAFRAAQRAYDLANEGRFTKACQQFARAVSEVREPYLINEYGLFLKANGLLAKAETVFQDLARMGQFMEDRLVIGSASRHLGDICEKTGRPEAADEYYRKALSMEEGHNRILKQAGLYESRGMLSLKSGAAKEAVRLFNKSLELYKQAELAEGQALSYYCLTGAYIELEDVEKAMDAGMNALTLFRQLDEPAMIDKLRTLLDKLEEIQKHSGYR